MAIYLMMNGTQPVRAFENIQLAKQQLDAYMFNLCKQGFRILSSRDGEYTYQDPKDPAIRYNLRLTEVELQK
jgi:hypothetical protein